MILKGQTERPILVCQKGKVYLKKFRYEKLHNPEQVVFDDVQLSAFVTHTKEGFQSLMNWTQSSRFSSLSKYSDSKAYLKTSKSKLDINDSELLNPQNFHSLYEDANSSPYKQ